MYGTWLTLIFAGVGLVVLLIALAFSAFAPVIGVVVGLFLVVAAVLFLSGKRTGQVGQEHEAADRERREAGGPAGRAQGPASGGAPAAGEGA
jgi:fatty acid desaturase